MWYRDRYPICTNYNYRSLSSSPPYISLSYLSLSLPFLLSLNYHAHTYTCITDCKNKLITLYPNSIIYILYVCGLSCTHAPYFSSYNIADIITSVLSSAYINAKNVICNFNPWHSCCRSISCLKGLKCEISSKTPTIIRSPVVAYGCSRCPHLWLY